MSSKSPDRNIGERRGVVKGICEISLDKRLKRIHIAVHGDSDHEEGRSFRRSGPLHRPWKQQQMRGPPPPYLAGDGGDGRGEAGTVNAPAVASTIPGALLKRAVGPPDPKARTVSALPVFPARGRYEKTPPKKAKNHTSTHTVQHRAQ